MITETIAWQVTPERGFLLNPQPLERLTTVAGLDVFLPSAVLEQLEHTADQLPALIQSAQLRHVVDQLPALDVTPLEDHPDVRVPERLMLLYAYLASGYIFMRADDPSTRLPAAIAVPLFNLAQIVGRPPILSYALMVLGNWRLRDVRQSVALDNLVPLHSFLDLPDEHHFGLVHVTIEAQGALALRGAALAHDAAQQRDAAGVIAGLEQVTDGIDQMTVAFHEMPRRCNPDVYYHQIRPYLMSFTEVVYEGVEAYGSKPQSLRGGSGAQSGIVPAIVNALGVQHKRSSLTAHLDVMREYMPPLHRKFIAAQDGTVLRSMIAESGSGELRDAYNRCLQQLIKFRRVHFGYATVYISARGESQVGTGGTLYADWLMQLIKETERHLL